jgi:hypothetical protein
MSYHEFFLDNGLLLIISLTDEGGKIGIEAGADRIDISFRNRDSGPADLRNKSGRLKKIIENVEEE